MAWSPPALERRLWLVEQAGDYAAPHPGRPRLFTGTGMSWQDLVVAGAVVDRLS